MVENNFIEPSDSIVFSPINRSPFGPMIIPEIINPIIEGIRTFLRRIGESRMMKSNKEKTSTGFLIGIMNAAKKCSKKYFI
jgi:hypothetical protein